MQGQFPQLFNNQYQSLPQSENQYSNIYQHQHHQTSLIINPKIDMIITRHISDNEVYQELLEQYDLSSILEDSKFDLSHLLRKVSELMNIIIDRYQILLYYEFGEMYISFGIYPFLENHSLSFQQFCMAGRLSIKLKKSLWSLIHLQMGRDMTEYMMNGPPKLLKDQSCPQKIVKQSSIKNFQKIGYIVKKILSQKSKKLKKSRRVNFDFKNDRNFTQKSVEDYFYQIKQGFKYNFDFNSNCNQNMKILREYVKYHDERGKKNPQKIAAQTNEFELT